jgi:lipopolysaccharide assembly outer membrane protein LptD (OstA)
MKPLTWNLVAACALFVLLPHAAPTQDAPDSQLHWFGVTPNAKLHIAADRIVREDPPNSGPSPVASLVHLQGNVEIRTCCVSYQSSVENPNPRSGYVILNADEADYHEETGEIEAHGTVRISFQPK